MIRPLRSRHRRAMAVLAALVPAGFGLSIAARPDFPGAEVEALGEAEGLTSLGDLPLRARIVHGALLEVVPTADLRRPDVLLYSTSRAGPFVSLPPDARLIGGLSGLQPRSFPLETGSGDPSDPGKLSLVLFSLGHQEVLGSAALPSTE